MRLNRGQEYVRQNRSSMVHRGHFPPQSAITLLAILSKAGGSGVKQHTTGYQEQSVMW